jgi:hypothetical protein
VVWTEELRAASLERLRRHYGDEWVSGTGRSWRRRTGTCNPCRPRGRGGPRPGRGVKWRKGVSWTATAGCPAGPRGIDAIAAGEAEGSVTMKVYFDNDVVSAISRRDGDVAELRAIDQLREEARAGRIVLGTSRQSQWEMERAPPHHQAKLKTGLSGLNVSEDDHKLLGFYSLTDQYGGFISNPMFTDIVDEQLYSYLLDCGLKPDDAKHLMYAVHTGHERFLTCDRGILYRRSDLEKRCPSIRVQKPSELVAELSIVNGGEPDAQPDPAPPGAPPCP